MKPEFTPRWRDRLRESERRQEIRRQTNAIRQQTSAIQAVIGQLRSAPARVPPPPPPPPPLRTIKHDFPLFSPFLFVAILALGIGLLLLAAGLST